MTDAATIIASSLWDGVVWVLQKLLIVALMLMRGICKTGMQIADQSLNALGHSIAADGTEFHHGVRKTWGWILIAAMALLIVVFFCYPFTTVIRFFGFE